MLRARDEWLHTQLGHSNPYDVDDETTWLDWRRRRKYAGFWRFVQKMIASRRSHPSIARSRFWRDDVHWFGPRGVADLSHAAVAWCLRGASRGDRDLYAMVNGGDEPATFVLQDTSHPWHVCIDTSRDSPEDIELDHPPLLERPSRRRAHRKRPRVPTTRTSSAGTWSKHRCATGSSATTVSRRHSTPARRRRRTSMSAACWRGSPKDRSSCASRARTARRGRGATFARASTMSFVAARNQMVDQHIRARGVRDLRVLEAMRTVPREEFVPAELAEQAYEDRPLPIEAEQTISQPYIVAVMAEALALRPTDRVLEIGAGSGYAAAVLSRIAKEVYTIERHHVLADSAKQRLQRLRYTNIEVLEGDGTLGWPAHAPFDAIVVAAGGPDVPPALREQLAIGGRLVIPVGTGRAQELVRVTRTSATEYRREDLGAVTFVPLIGAQGWAERPEDARKRRGVLPRREPGPLVQPAPAARMPKAAKLVAECAEPLASIDETPLDELLERIGDARVVLLGECTHGTSEFYRMRAHITRGLILRRGFRAVAIEGDWPDASAVDQYVRHRSPRTRPWTPFSRFPTWMWRNTETHELIEWLRAYNADADHAVSFSGLDLYSMYTSAYEVVRYLDRVDPTAAGVARDRYGRLTPWQHDPAAYGRAALANRMRSCEKDVLAMLRELLAKRLEYSAQDGTEFFDAAQNARVVAGAESYYRAMYYGAAESWNLRDQHMFDTMRSIIAHRGNAKLIVWEHNSHVGDAGATEMSVRGEHNVGQLSRAEYGDNVYIIGFGTDRGTVAAAHAWDEPMQRMRVRPSRSDSYERICHDSGVPAFLLPLRDGRQSLRDELADPRLERAIGVVYRPDTELQSHYFQAVLPAQFDEYIWFDETEAVHPLTVGEPLRANEAHPLAP